MQSESTEYSPYSPNTPSDTSSNTAQHGFHSSAPGIQPALEDDPFEGQSRGAVEPDNAPCGDFDQAMRLSKAIDAEEEQQQQRNHINTPVKAIIEYENALLPPSPKVEDDGSIFKVVPSKPGRKAGQRLDQFPNGRHARSKER